ncbi:MAG: PIN domain nuclease [Flammeovirgaceae bacterium]|nr:MAG: PIN domain nuclease [Flammeovirgaceae bacterium]
MQRILVDTTVWVDYFNGKSTEQVKRLVEFMERDETICLSPTILQEILQGIKSDKQYERIYELLFGYTILISDPLKSAIEAAQLYRNLRKKGVTIRKSSDCLIAWYAISHNVMLLHNDKDFEVMATHTSLQLI